MPEFFHGSDSQCDETFPLMWSNETSDVRYVITIYQFCVHYGV